MTYVFVYCVLLAGGAISAGRPASRKVVYALLLVGLFMFVAFRFEVGCDWPGYKIIYDQQSASTIGAVLRSREPLFLSLNVLLHYLSLDYPYINVFAALAYFSGFHLLARRQPDPLGLLILSFPLLVLHLAMSGIRQAIAIGILCVAFNFFNDRRWVGYCCLVVLASGFHASALIFLSLVPFALPSFRRLNVLVGALTSVPFLYMLATSQNFEVYYDRYVASEAEAFGAPFRSALVSIVGVCFLFLMHRRWKRSSPGDYKLISICAPIMSLTFPLTLMSSVIGDRFGYYMMPFQLLIAAKLPFLFREKMLWGFPYVVGFLVLLVWIMLSSLFRECYVPYRSWIFAVR